MPSEQRNKRIKRSHDASISVQWPSLSAPAESHALANHRRSGFDNILIQQQIQETDDVHRGMIDKLLSFINTSASSATDRRLPTALLMTGLDKSSSQSILDHASREFAVSRSCIFVSLQSRQCPNLQTALKNLIKTAIIQHSNIATYNEFLSKNKRFHPLNFDLELLKMFIEEIHVKKVIVSVSDVEDVDFSVVNDLINGLQLWRTQIPSVLLLGITSTQELFEHRLSKSSLKQLNARTFDFTPSLDQASRILRTLQTSNREDNRHRIFLGPSTMKTLLDLNQGQGNNAQSLRANIHYLALSHFVADPVSALADSSIGLHADEDVKMLANLARSTASFKQYCENLVDDSAITPGSHLKPLLDKDSTVLEEVQRAVMEGNDAYTSVSKLIYAFSDFYQELSRHLPTLRHPRLEIELQLYQTMNDLTNCQAFDDVRDGVTSLNHRQLKDVLGACPPEVIQSLGLQNVLDSLMSELDEETLSSPQRNGTHDPPARTVLTKPPRVKSKKAGKSPAKGTRHDAKTFDPFSEELVSSLARKLQVSSLDTSSLLLHEAYLLSSRTIRFKQNFDVQPRVTMERALLKPGDYLTCDCCSTHRPVDEDDNQDAGDVTPTPSDTVSPSMPPACMLFTLLQEAPTIINVRDLFDAFSSHLNKQTNSIGLTDGDEDDSVSRTMILFYRALAELKMMGLIKASAGTQVKKRTAGGRASKTATQDVDFIAKTSWAGS